MSRTRLVFLTLFFAALILVPPFLLLRQDRKTREAEEEHARAMRAAGYHEACQTVSTTCWNPATKIYLPCTRQDCQWENP